MSEKKTKKNDNVPVSAPAAEKPFVPEDIPADGQPGTEPGDGAEYESFRAKYAGRIDEENSKAAKKACARAVSILSRLEGMLNILAVRYGVRPGDLDSIVRGVMTDPALSDGIATVGEKDTAFAGGTTDYYRGRINGGMYDEWQRDAERIRRTYDPSFELDEQLGTDAEFARLLKSGVNAYTAYYLRHKQEIDGIAAGKIYAAGSVGAKRVAVRPSENGSSDISSVSFGFDMKHLSKEAREEIRRKVKAGEKIRL